MKFIISDKVKIAKGKYKDEIGTVLETDGDSLYKVLLQGKYSAIEVFYENELELVD